VSSFGGSRTLVSSVHVQLHECCSLYLLNQSSCHHIISLSPASVITTAELLKTWAQSKQRICCYITVLWVVPITWYLSEIHWNLPAWPFFSGWEEQLHCTDMSEARLSWMFLCGSYFAYCRYLIKWNLILQHPVFRVISLKIAFLFTVQSAEIQQCMYKLSLISVSY